jgi:predicted RNase H-like HicB family nuclease
MKINKQLFDFILGKPRLLNVLLKFSNFEKFPLLQRGRNKLLAKAIEGIYSAGETLESAEIRMMELERENIGIILNYAMEAGKLIKIVKDIIFCSRSKWYSHHGIRIS